MNNMRIYDLGRAVPDNAVKKITGGAYAAAGLSDINPQWRIEKMTEIFGACGEGWYIEPQNVWVEGATMLAHIHLYYKLESGEWSKPVNGWGGTELKAKGGNDDIVKSTITDAFSNACRYLGIGADVWLRQYDTKYSAPTSAERGKTDKAQQQDTGAIGRRTTFQRNEVRRLCNDTQFAVMEQKYGKNLDKMTFEQANKAIDALKKRAGENTK